jgi:hypothetical protein
LCSNPILKTENARKQCLAGMSRFRDNDFAGGTPVSQVRCGAEQDESGGLMDHDKK